MAVGMSSLSISTSGLLASSAQVASAARAAAGLRTAEDTSKGRAARNPIDIVDIAGGSGARSTGAATQSYGAGSASAATPCPAMNIDPVQSTLGQISATATYQDNVAAIRTAEAMLQSLLATVA